MDANGDEGSWRAVDGQSRYVDPVVIDSQPQVDARMEVKMEDVMQSRFVRPQQGVIEHGRVRHIKRDSGVSHRERVGNGD